MASGLMFKVQRGKKVENYDQTCLKRMEKSSLHPMFMATRDSVKHSSRSAR